MRNIRLIIFGLVALTFMNTSCYRSYFIGVTFYNVENLFDTIDDPNTFDGQYLPDSAYGWNTDKYNTKITNLAKVLSTFSSGLSPDFLGLCEIENRAVLEDLAASEKLKPMKYKIVHYESKDARGIDVGAFYNPQKLELIESGIQKVDLSKYNEITRDILWVKMKDKLYKGTFFFIVNHWPSRRGGLEKSEPKRIIAAQTLKKLKDSLLLANPTANVVVMGDFNDEPDNKSIVKALGATGDSSQISNSQLFNVMASLQKEGKGSYLYRGNWNMLDQMMINNNLTDSKTWHIVSNSADIRDDDWLKQQSGRFAGYPLRTFGGRNYLAGYSDHFAVSLVLTYYSE